MIYDDKTICTNYYDSTNGYDDIKLEDIMITLVDYDNTSEYYNNTRRYYNTSGHYDSHLIIHASIFLEVC